MKKLIGRINVLGQKYRIYESDNLPENINGYCFFEAKTIEIRAGLDKETFRKIYTHEFFHAALHEMEFFVTGIEPQLEEMLVNQLAIIFSKNYAAIAKHLK